MLKIMLKIILLFITLPIITSYSAASEIKPDIGSEKIKIFNKILSQIEKDIKEYNNKQICLKAKEVSSLIKNNIDDFKALEKNYHWNDIRDLFESIASQTCKE